MGGYIVLGGSTFLVLRTTKRVTPELEIRRLSFPFRLFAHVAGGEWLLLEGVCILRRLDLSMLVAGDNCAFVELYTFRCTSP